MATSYLVPACLMIGGRIHIILLRMSLVYGGRPGWWLTIRR